MTRIYRNQLYPDLLHEQSHETLHRTIKQEKGDKITLRRCLLCRRSIEGIPS